MKLKKPKTGDHDKSNNWKPFISDNDDLSFYEGGGEGPDVAKVKQAVKKL